MPMKILCSNQEKWDSDDDRGWNSGDDSFFDTSSNSSRFGSPGTSSGSSPGNPNLVTNSGDSKSEVLDFFTKEGLNTELVLKNLYRWGSKRLFPQEFLKTTQAAIQNPVDRAFVKNCLTAFSKMLEKPGPLSRFCVSVDVKAIGSRNCALFLENFIIALEIFVRFRVQPTAEESRDGHVKIGLERTSTWKQRPKPWLKGHPEVRKLALAALERFGYTDGFIENPDLEKPKKPFPIPHNDVTWD